MGALKSIRCARGHLMRGDNLYIRSNGLRQCLKCKAEMTKEYREQKKRELKAKRREYVAKQKALGLPVERIRPVRPKTEWAKIMGQAKPGKTTITGGDV